MCNVMHMWIEWLLLQLLLLQGEVLLSNGDCDRLIQSTINGPKSGTFESPDWPKYHNNMHCIYKFVALPQERVHLSFTDFHVKGIPPRCEDDYIDVYTQASRPDQNILDMPLQGRYCGDDLENLPSLFVSEKQTLLIGFYTDKEDTDKGFRGNYAFEPNDLFDMGTVAPDEKCGFTVYSSNRPQGFIMSPTFPGIYPDNTFCYYKLLGEPGQRIKLEFKAFDLFSGGEHCPFDYVKVYDGYTREAEPIGTYCGKHEMLTLYSTNEALRIEFVTKSGRVKPTKKPYKTYWELHPDYEIERRGFKAKYTFSDKYVKLDYIKRRGTHIRGTECDMRVLSTGESNGTIVSPNYPAHYPPNVTCHYFIDGRYDKENLEKVSLSFKTFHIPPYSNSKPCDGGAKLLAFTKGQMETDPSDLPPLCGNSPPKNITTSKPRLLLVLDTHSNTPTGKGFEAFYEFKIDFDIPGTMVTPRECHFLYKSSISKRGSFNSPRQPSSYPPGVNCFYEFIGLPDEQVRITFDTFKLAAGDYVEVYNVFDYKVNGSNSQMIRHSTGTHAPGPILSEYNVNRMKVIFKSDPTAVNMGFLAHYDFVPKVVPFADCGKNISSGYGGVIYSPGFPKKYNLTVSCDWYIYPTAPQNEILIQYVDFDLEGAGNDCQNAILQIYTGGPRPTSEICGQATNKMVILANFIRIRFIVGPNSVGDKGFKITWTEIMKNKLPCDGFQCLISKYCIAKHLECNDYPNCGGSDDSDETVSCPKPPAYNILHIALGVAITLFLLIVLLVCMFHRRQKSKKKRKADESDIRFMIDQGHCSSRTTDRMINRETMQKISIV
ncbi:cubilin-like [Tubulanus polymorphus]|uniref:cubilin-like n=1 Tax=Tubulanus polymorphus TaxID=672921 RepID=UPI003DA2EE83